MKTSRVNTPGPQMTRGQNRLVSRLGSISEMQTPKGKTTVRLNNQIGVKRAELDLGGSTTKRHNSTGK